MSNDKIMASELTETIVYDYDPPVFPVNISQPASDFIIKQGTSGTDFIINELSAEQAGINKFNSEAHSVEVEELALEKIKEIQERAYQEAYDLGVLEGTEKAFEDLKEEFRQRLDLLDEVLASFDDVKQRIFEHNEAHFVKMLYLLSKKIAFKEIEEDKGHIVNLITHLIEDLHGAERVVVKLNPEDLVFIENLRERGVKEVEALSNVKMDIGENIKPGGCVLETNYGDIDATLDQRVDKVWEVLQGRLPRLDPNERSLPTEVDSEEIADPTLQDSSTESVGEVLSEDNTPVSATESETIENESEEDDPSDTTSKGES